jgi:2-iminobutanoate/2-iminopropanoate deaminase
LSTSGATRTPVSTTDAPAAMGPYSQAIRYGDVLYCSGQIPLNAAGEKTAFGSLTEQTTQCLNNLTAVCRAAGTDLSNAVRMTVYTTQLEGFAEINEAYGAFFGDGPPARVTIGVSALPAGANVEIDAVVGIAG